jgi:hypothetical protein
MNRHQPFSSLFHGLMCGPNQSRNIWRCTYNAVLWAFCTFNATAWLSVGFIVFLKFVFTLVWIIEIAILVKLIWGVGNAFGFNVFITFHWMTVDSSDSVEV